ncbi:hypothetical protein F4778DRAFT_786120 [Xylariomycetidae sp. FL2044]|nr:hypothetical protein F4778DRAFT_786120 [Xylariomycetidae sp. FL2044]
MPSKTDIQQMLDSKPVGFTIKTAGGNWKCELHQNRASYERKRSSNSVAPGISRSDTGSSTSTTGSGSSH